MIATDEVYDSMCELAQKLIDKMENESITLSQDQFNELQRKIDKIHKHMEEYSKQYRT
jgi:ribonuclease HIII